MINNQTSTILEKPVCSDENSFKIFETLLKSWTNELKSKDHSNTESAYEEYCMDKDKLQSINEMNIPKQYVSLFIGFSFLTSLLFIPIGMILLRLSDFSASFVFNTMTISWVIIFGCTIGCALTFYIKFINKIDLKYTNKSIKNFEKIFINPFYDANFLEKALPELEKNTTEEQFNNFKLAIFEKKIRKENIAIFYIFLKIQKSKSVKHLSVQELLGN